LANHDAAIDRIGAAGVAAVAVDVDVAEVDELWMV
jgi:hypothetical protein